MRSIYHGGWFCHGRIEKGCGHSSHLLRGSDHEDLWGCSPGRLESGMWGDSIDERLTLTELIVRPTPISSILAGCGGGADILSI